MLKSALRSMFGRRSAPKVHGPTEPHEWTAIPGLESFPQRLCRCGMMKGGVQSGDKTVTVGPGGNNLIRYSALTGPQVAGDIAANPATGRPSAFMNGHGVSLGSRGEGGWRRNWRYQNNYQSGAVDAVGGPPALTQNGALALSNGAPFNGNQYSSAAVANSDAGWLTAVDFSTNHNFSIGFTFRVGSDLTNTRLWIGVFAANPMGSSAPLNSIGFRYDTSVDGTVFWRAYSAGPVSSNVVVTTVPVSGNQDYFARIDETEIGGAITTYLSIQQMDASENALLNNVATFTTNVPSGGANLIANAQVRTLTATTKFITLGVIDTMLGLNMEL